MPIYDYKCRECGKVSEVLLRTADDRSIRCPDCGSNNLERLISASRMIAADSRSPGSTCCGRAERCDMPPCSSGEACRTDRA